MTKQQAREQPRHACRHRTLNDHESALPPSLDTAYRGCFAAPDRLVTEVEGSQFQSLQGVGLGVHAPSFTYLVIAF
jgi:hypothetical protein